MLKILRFSLDKVNGTENVLFFLLRALTHQNFTFILRFLYELMQMVRFSKTMCGILHF